MDNPQEFKGEVEQKIIADDGAPPPYSAADSADGATPPTGAANADSGTLPVSADTGNVKGSTAPSASGADSANGGAPPPPADTKTLPQTLNLRIATPSPVVADTRVVASTPSTITIGKKLSLWMLSIVAGSILLLVIYLWHMENSAADDIRQNYGREINRDNVALYMKQRIQRFSNDLSKAQNNPSFAAPKNNISDDKDLSDTLGSLPDVTDEQRSQLIGCVSAISNKQADGAERKAILQPCIDFLEQEKSDGLTAASEAMSHQMASEASAKLLEERVNLHEFWLKAAQLILLNLLLPLLTAVIGYTFGHQTNQSQGSSQQGSSQEADR